MDCAWVKKPDNAWRTFARKIRDCIGEAKAPTTLSADGTKCTGADTNVVVRFHKPLAAAPAKLDSVASDFSIEVGGRTCLRRVANVEGSTTTGTHKESVRFVAPQGETANATIGPKDVVLDIAKVAHVEGSLYEILFGPCSSEVQDGGFPLTDFTREDDGSVAFKLGGMKVNPLFSCKK